MTRGILVCLAASLCVASSAEAAPRTATFSLSIGVNGSREEALPRLSYADDDAARFFDLFRTLGHKAHLLAELDDNTRGLHSQAAAESLVPSRVTLDETLAELRRSVLLARQRGLATVVHVSYAGHGRLTDQGLALALADGEILGDELLGAIASVSADAAHLIVDACGSYYLALSRGPGGQRRTVSGFTGLGSSSRVGLVLSTSSAQESHEWEAWQAGVFSHEVRSGLYGAADADRDGKVSYREISAFVSRANESVVNERFRPRIFVRPPVGEVVLLELGQALARRVEVGPSLAGHYYLEDGLGVRLAEFHSSKGSAVRLLRPASSLSLYLRRADGSREYELPQELQVATVETLASSTPKVLPRGAAHEAFRGLFSLPFDRDTVRTAKAELGMPAGNLVHRASPAAPRQWKRPTGVAATVLGGLAIVTGAIVAGLSTRVGDTLSEDASQVDVQGTNDTIGAYNGAGAGLLIGGGVVTAVGVSLVVWASKKE